MPNETLHHIIRRIFALHTSPLDEVRPSDYAIKTAITLLYHTSQLTDLPPLWEATDSADGCLTLYWRSRERAAHLIVPGNGRLNPWMYCRGTGESGRRDEMIHSVAAIMLADWLYWYRTGKLRPMKAILQYNDKPGWF